MMNPMTMTMVMTHSAAADVAHAVYGNDSLKHAHRRYLARASPGGGKHKPSAAVVLPAAPLELLYDGASQGTRALTVDGRSAWTLVPVPATTNVFNIVSSVDGLYLSAHTRGRHLHLVSRDDGSGRQRWKIAASKEKRWYTVTLEGGKLDAVRLLAGGMLAGDDGKLVIADSSHGLSHWVTRGIPSPPPTPVEAPPTPVEAVPGADQFPDGTLDELRALTGLTTLQLTNVLAMIAGPEQARTEWWLDASGRSIYGYAEAIGDGRGVTIGPFGATTGRGYEDADAIWKAYGNTDLGKLPEAELIAKVRSLEDDPAWRRAVWDAYIATYWRPARELTRAHGFGKALTLGAVLDAAMNAGIEDDSSKSWGAAHLVQAAHDASGPDEDAFVAAFLDLRARYPTERSGDMDRRIGAWRRLARKNAWNLEGLNIADFVYIP
jgi:chitosanase